MASYLLLTQCIAAQVCSIYDTNAQKDEGCHSLPLPCRPRGSEDTSLSSDHQASHGLSTIERKLLASNPVKPDSNPVNPRYGSADQFVADVRLIFSNCVTFNGPEHVVTQQGKRVEAVFDKQIKQLPPSRRGKMVLFCISPRS
jgi:hypothetical protein